MVGLSVYKVNRIMSDPLNIPLIDEDYHVPFRSRFTRWCGRATFHLFGWKMEGEIPKVKKFIITAAPHTSNWDFVFGLAAILAIGIKARWLGKHTIFSRAGKSNI